MTYRFRQTLAPLLLGALLGTAPLPVAAEGDALAVQLTQQISPRLVEYQVYSPALERDVTVRVHLPTRYAEQADRRWPMALLLHGRSENGTTWSDQVDLDAYDDLLFVMPDGGLVGWYTDWVDETGFEPQRWETFHIHELLPWVERTFRVAEGRSQRFIAGDSMGGFGAMKYAARYPDKFGAAAELSGFVDLLLAGVSGVVGVDGQSFQAYQVPPGAIFGDRITQEVIWRGNNPVDLAQNLANTDLVLRHGNGLPGEFGGNADAGEAAIRLTGISFHTRLDQLGIDHLWDDYGNGVHTWPYWEKGLRIAMPRWQAVAAAAEPAPVPFSYTTINPVFSIYGFDVNIQREVTEFASLQNVTPEQFTLTGSGSAEITTSDWYEADAAYRVRVDDAEPQTLRSDSAGRLHFTVDLGPAHSNQQYTPVALAEELALGDAYFAFVTITISPASDQPNGRTDGGLSAGLPSPGLLFLLCSYGLLRPRRTGPANNQVPPNA